MLLVDNAPSHSSSELPNNTNKTLSVNNVENKDYQSSSENEDLMNDSPAPETMMKLKDHLKSNKKDNAEAHAEDHVEAHAEDHVEAHAKDLVEAHAEEQEPIPILLADEIKNIPRR